MHVIHTETRHTQLTDIESYISQRQQITTTNDVHCTFASRHLKRPIHVFNAADNTMRICSHSETSTQSFKPHPICLLHEPDKAYSILTHAYLSKYHTGLLYHRTASAVGSAPQTNTGWDSSTGHRPHRNYAPVFSAHTTPSQGSASDTSSSPTSLAGSSGSGTDSENSASHTSDIRDTTLEDDSDIEAPTHAPIPNSESHRSYAYRDDPRRFTYLYSRIFNSTVPFAPITAQHSGYLSGNMAAHTFSSLHNYVHTVDAGTLTTALLSQNAPTGTCFIETRRDIVLNILEHADAARAGRDAPRGIYDTRSDPNMFILPYNTRLWGKIPVAKILLQHRKFITKWH